MALRKLKIQDTQFLDEAERKLRKGVPLIVRMEGAFSDPKEGIRAAIIAGPNAGREIMIQQAPTLTHGPDQLIHAIEGTKYTPALVQGDIIAFSRSYFQGETLMAGRIGARTHDKMLGNVQVMLAAARPSKSSVNKTGAYQNLTIVNPAGATVVNNLIDAEKFLRKCEENATPGERVGFIIRDRQRECEEFFPDDERDVDFFLEELDHGEVFDGETPYAMIPTTLLPVGRDQIARELGDPTRKTDGAVRGKLSRQYTPEKSSRAGFIQSLVIVNDEEEWKFGGKTGKTIRVAGGIQPSSNSEPVLAERLNIDPHAGNVAKVSKFFKKEQMVEAEKERRKRCPINLNEVDVDVPEHDEPQGRGLRGMRR